MKKPQEHYGWRAWLVLFVVSLAAVVQAEDVTVTTYYPSPRGNYQTLSTTGNTNLVANPTNPTDRVVVGPTADSTTRLEVRGRLQMMDGTQSPGRVLQSDLNGVASWVDPNTITGIVTGPGTVNFIPLWMTPSNLGSSVIQQSGLNIGIGAPPGLFKLDVVGTERISGTLTLSGLPVSCPVVGATKLLVGPTGDVLCGTDQVNDADSVIGNEFNVITGGAGITVTGSPPAATVALANPIKTCPAGQVMFSFDLTTGLAPTCVLAGGVVGTVFGLTQGANTTLSGPGVTGVPPRWNPNLGEATIAATVGGTGLPSGAAGDTLRNTAAGVNWVANNVIFNNGTNVGIGTALPNAKLAVVGQATFGPTAFAPPGSEPISTSGVGSGISLADRGIGARRVIYPSGDVLRFWRDPTGDQLTIGPTGRVDIIGSGADLFVGPNRVCQAGVAIVGCGGSGGPAGTSGQTLRYDALNTLVANSTIFNNGTNVGIGTASPNGLQVNLGVNETNQAADNVRLGIFGTPRIIFDGAAPIWEIDNSGGSFRIFNPGVVQLSINSTGRVDIPGSLFVASAEVCRAGVVIPGCSGGGGSLTSLTLTTTAAASATLSPNPWSSGAATLNIPSGGGGGTGTLTGGVNITLSPNPWDPGSGISATISATAGPGGSVGPGTLNRVAKFTSGSTVGDSSIIDNGTTVQFTGAGIYNAAGFQLVETNATDWTRWNQGARALNGNAMYQSLALGTGGLSVGAWSNPGLGNISATGTATIGTDAFVAGSRVCTAANGVCTGGGGGGEWTRTGTAVHLTTGTDFVGIGTASPRSKLHVNVGPDVNLRVRSQSELGLPGAAWIDSVNDLDSAVMPLRIRGAPIILDGTVQGATYGFGGMFMYVGNGPGCATPNVFTGACTCPGGFLDTHLHWVVDSVNVYSVRYCYK